MLRICNNFSLEMNLVCKLISILFHIFNFSFYIFNFSFYFISVLQTISFSVSVSIKREFLILVSVSITVHENIAAKQPQPYIVLDTHCTLN